MKSRKPPELIVAATVIGVIAVAAGCGGTKSTASKSAEQYDAARAKGEPIKTEEGHGGHAPQPNVAVTASPGAAMDHAAMGHTSPSSPADRSAGGSGLAGMDHSAMSKAGDEDAAMDHARMPVRTTAPTMAGMDHSKMPMPSIQRRAAGNKAMDHSGMSGMAHAGTAVTQRGSPAMDHSRMPESGHMDHSTNAAHPGAPAMAGMDHENMAGTSAMPGMQHGATTTPLPEPPSRAAVPAEPARTLQPDPLDMPAPTAVEEAAQAAAMATEMAGGHMMSHGTYRQTDAGRDQGTVTPAAMPPGHQMDQAPTQEPSTEGGHQMHAAPAASPRPTGTPSAPAHQHQPSRAQPAPSPDPHLQHAPSAPASPSPRPSPTPKESNE